MTKYASQNRTIGNLCYLSNKLVDKIIQILEFFIEMLRNIRVKVGRSSEEHVRKKFENFLKFSIFEKNVKNVFRKISIFYFFKIIKSMFLEKSKLKKKSSNFEKF